MFSRTIAKMMKRKSPPMVNVCIVEEQHPNHWAQKNDVHLLYRHDNFYANVSSLDGHTCGAAKIISASDCEEL